MGHESVRGGAVPVLFAGFDVDDVAGADLSDTAGAGGDESDAVRDVQRLAFGVLASRRRPGTRRRPPNSGTPACCGVSFARRVARKSLTSLRLSMISTLQPAAHGEGFWQNPDNRALFASCSTALHG
jgi:hypothetical protein